MVDDDRRLRELLSRYLSRQGYRVTTAGDAAEARRHLKGLDFDLIVLDVMMPGESGVEFTKDLRNQSQVPILMLTARAEANDRVLGFETGVDDYLTKTVRYEGIVAAHCLDPAPRGAEASIQAHLVCFGPFVFHCNRGELRQGDEIIA